MRKQTIHVVAIGALVLLAGCSSFSPTTTPPPPPAEKRPPPAIGASTAPVGNICNAGAAQWAVGQSATVSVTEKARVRSGARMARVLRPGQAVTQEVDPQRLNLELDASGKIVKARCG
ncbi:I78 family peptidase inhibitor [Diaphorobacter sp.]|uniref:I78 family peptidase inhibitor n=1 Tax=Diaphorobacter sp. TaxID=1934310 RepID=UPI0028A888DE|nr:I78 family peptidase inhibitor [Diaphorobacter sp.]